MIDRIAQEEVVENPVNLEFAPRRDTNDLTVSGSHMAPRNIKI